MKLYHVTMQQLSAIVRKLFMGMGYQEKEAAYAADIMTETNRRGVDTHGVTRIPFYYRNSMAEDRVNKTALLSVLRDEPPFLMVDANHGLGIIMAPQAVELAISRAKEQGICVMGIQNSGHFGAAGYYAAKCVEQGFISLVCSNTPSAMTPIGGVGRALGNSPWSMAMPGGNRHPDPIMFDMACSEVALGKLETAIRENREVPLGWGVNKEGKPTTDPVSILGGGFLLPFGGIKGYCISILIETLSSMLTFASYGNGKNMGGANENTSHFILLLDPARFGDKEMYKKSIDEYVDSIKSTARAPGVEEILIPGEIEARAMKERTEKGMHLDEIVADSLAEVAQKCGLLTENQDFGDMLAWDSL